MVTILKDVRTIQSWQEWLEQWNKAELTEIRHSLLHVVPTVPYDYRINPETHQGENEAEAERWIFLLDLADGWTSASSLSAANDSPDALPKTAFGENMAAKDLRRVLAQKAFTVLREHFFTLDPERNNDSYDPARNKPDWARAVANEAVLAKLLWFFRLAKSDGFDEYLAMPNLPWYRHYYDSQKTLYHHLEKTRDFLFDLFRFTHGFRQWEKREWGEESKETKQTKATFTKHRLDLIDLLYGIRRLDYLERNFEIADDREVMKHLRELALNDSRRESGNTKTARTIEESWSECNNPAARILILIDAGAKARKRVDEERREQEKKQKEEWRTDEEQRRKTEAAKLRAQADKLEGKK